MHCKDKARKQMEHMRVKKTTRTRGGRERIKPTWRAIKLRKNSDVLA